MPSWREFYTPKLLTAKAVGKRRIKGTILACDPHKIKNDDKTTTTKLVLVISDLPEGVALNQFNAGRIAKAYGDDTDDWVGKRVIIYTGPVPLKDKTVQGIIVEGTK